MSDVPSRLSAALAGRYRVERELGAGGMATVFLAHDLKHGRDVAIKVLHPDLGAALGAERFLSEIKTTAKLQHPHILPLLDSGEADGLLYYVMPYVAGETLRSRLAREKQLPMDDVALLAREVADALGYAHALGIIHRDIKPENILLQGGHALVADFGIALAVQTAGGQRMTQTGLSLGTPQYMSPEQAMGERSVDARSDVYALGAVTYEMIVGDPPFTGSTVQAIVAKVLNERPTAPSSVRDTVPAGMEQAVLRALAKLPADRWPTAAAFATALVAPGLAQAQPHATGARVPAPSTRQNVIGLAAAALLLSVGAYAAGRATSRATTAVVGTLGRAVQVTWEPGLEITPAISPDGKQVVFAHGNGTKSQLFVRPVSGGRATPLTDDSTAVETDPSWSRDGTRVLFIRNGQVVSAPAGGGPPRQEVPSRGGVVVSATWSADERRIAFVIGDTVFVRAADGTSKVLAMAPAPALCSWGPGELIACAAMNLFYLKPGLAFGNVAPSFIAVINAANGHVTAVTDSAFANEAPRWSADGRHLLYVSNRLGLPDIYAIAVDGDGRASGQPARITTGLNVSSFSLSADGTRMAYAVMTASANVWTLPWNGTPVTGSVRPTQVTFGQQTIEDASLSRDGQWMYFDSDLGGNPDLYRMRLPAGAPERLTSDATAEFAPEVSPDGKAVAFHSIRSASRDIYVLPLDGGPLETVTSTPQYNEALPVWSPDGSTLAFNSLVAPEVLYLARRDAQRRWQLTKRLDAGYWVSWSPDGKQLSFATGLLGGGLRVVSVDGGAPRALYDERQPGAPVAETSTWSADGRTVWFKSHEPNGDASIWGVPSTGGTPRRLLTIGDERLRSDRYGFHVSGGKIYFVLTDRQANVWVMDIAR
jgi:serine/threonine-protein kinase